jgi:hypothetical protein
MRITDGEPLCYRNMLQAFLEGAPPVPLIFEAFGGGTAASAGKARLNWP